MNPDNLLLIRATILLVWGVIAHIIADWFLQTEWQAIHKVKWQHPAAWLHSGIHFGFLLLVFPFVPALLLAMSHFWIDLRKPLQWWRRTIRQTTDPGNPATIHIAFWQDQCAHVLCLALASVLVALQM